MRGARGGKGKVHPEGPPQRRRTVRILDPAGNKKFISNSVRTSKYTLVSFVPKSLLEQFRRIANIYFLLISIIQVSTDLSPTNKFSTLIPLVIVLAITMIKEGLEDRKRHQADGRVNRSKATVIRGGKPVEVYWRDITCGDVIYLKNGDPVPADILILSASGHRGICHIETSNLDGETNLKIKQALDGTLPLSAPEHFIELYGTLECEETNKDLYEFDGLLKVSGSSLLGPQQPLKSPVDIRHVIWRGTTLMNTSWVYGLVFFTGQDTKLIRNSRETPSKRSNMDKTVNTAIATLFVTLALMCTASTLLHADWISSVSKDGVWYLPYVKLQSSLDTTLTWVTVLILYNNLVPISLYVTLEVVKVVQAFFINNDAQMYHAETDTPAAARTSNLNEDLGQIQYVFSDKTGTLTCNRMEFHKCSVAGVAYGKVAPAPGLQGSASSDRAENYIAVSPPRATATSPSSKLVTAANEGYNFADGPFLEALHKGDEHSDKLKEFLLALALCHTVMIQKDEGTNETHYRAASPDEGALVLAARKLGYEFVDRGANFVKIRANKEVLTYQVLNENQFSSDRKRMSVVIRTPDGKLVLYCKGADEVIFPRLRTELQGGEDELVMQSHLADFGTDGLRTLVIAKAELTEDTYREWNRRFQAAKNAQMDAAGKELLAELADEIEQDLELVGATAIEDKLQDGVPETIQLLSDAGIKVWMLTGDKLETAENIGFACRLLNNEQDIVKLSDASENVCKYTLAATLRKYERYIGTTYDRLALMVTGKALQVIMANVLLKNLFLQVCKLAKVVIACRVVPSQKAEIVQMVRFQVKPEPMTLAIGDGANDVAMIQEAHVGVGISGNEGMQAVRSADYSMAQFRFLQRLLLVHGRWNYRRVALTILYSFYKNITYVLTLFYYGFHNTHSGTTLYESFLGSGWNIGWTMLPVLALGFFERDIGDEAALLNPKVYVGGQRRNEFNAHT